MFKWSQADLIAIPIALFSIVALTIILYFVTKNKSDKIKSIPLKVVAGFLIVLEIAKQIYYISSGTYPLNVIPVHFCSLIVVLIAFAQFMPAKIANWFHVPSVVFSFVVLPLVLVHPHAMIGSASQGVFVNFHHFHAFVFHMLVIAYPIFNLVLIKKQLKLSNSFNLVACIAFYASYAIPVAFKLNINYMNILYSYFAPLEEFRLACGQVVYDIVLFLISMLACVCLFMLWYVIDKKVTQRRNKNA